VWIVTAAVLAPVCFFAVLILAGPHSSMLPSIVQPALLLAGLLIFLVTIVGRVGLRNPEGWLGIELAWVIPRERRVTDWRGRRRRLPCSGPGITLPPIA